MFLSSQHFEGKKGVLELQDGDYNKSQKGQLFIWPTQTKQQVGQCIIETL